MNEFDRVSTKKFETEKKKILDFFYSEGYVDGEPVNGYTYYSYVICLQKKFKENRKNKVKEITIYRGEAFEYYVFDVNSKGEYVDSREGEYYSKQEEGRWVNSYFSDEELNHIQMLFKLYNPYNKIKCNFKNEERKERKIKKKTTSKKKITDFTLESMFLEYFRKRGYRRNTTSKYSDYLFEFKKYIEPKEISTDYADEYFVNVILVGRGKFDFYSEHYHKRYGYNKFDKENVDGKSMGHYDEETCEYYNDKFDNDDLKVMMNFCNYYTPNSVFDMKTSLEMAKKEEERRKKEADDKINREKWEIERRKQEEIDYQIYLSHKRAKEEADRRYREEHAYEMWVESL